MAIEAISKPAVAYQGGTPAPETVSVSTESRPAADSVSIGGKESSTGMPSKEAIKKAVDEINKNAHNSEAVWGVHEATNRITIKIVDKVTRETIKEFPPEETLDMIAKVWEVAGILVDEKR